MTGEKSLSLALRFKPSHLLILLSCWLVGQCTSVVFVLLGGMFDAGNQLFLGG
jgi:hypothetical protein